METRASIERVTADERATIVARYATLEALRHPNLIPLERVEFAGNEVIGISTPIGQPLSKLQAAGPIAEVRVRAIGEQVLRALVALHGAGLVHREVWADMILLDGDVARLACPSARLAHDLARRYQTRAGVAYGSIHCAIPPEDFGGRDTGPYTDLYALAATLHESLRGRPMFVAAEGYHPLTVLGDVAQKPRPSLAIADAELAAAIMHGLAIDPAARPRSAAAMLAELGASVDEAPAEAALLDALRKEPGDVATRLVYADWLEEHGDASRAAFLRVESEPMAGDTRWRRITSRAPIAKCVTFAAPCPKRWDALASTGTDGVRFCGECQKPVYFCASVDEARQRGKQHACIAIDAAVARGEAEAAYDTSMFPPREERAMMMGSPRSDPDPKPGLVDRIRGLFRRS